MAADTERYAQLEDLQSRITDRQAAAPDLQLVLDGASAAVETYCHRTFTIASTATTRKYTPVSPSLTIVDDIGDLTGLAVTTGDVEDGYTEDITASTWLEPANAITRGRPVNDVRSEGLFPNPRHRQPTVQVTALWGWPAVPGEIGEAVLLLASRLWMRRQSPTGVTGAGEFGVVRVSHSDPDVTALLRPFVRSVF